MPGTYEPIATNTLGSATATVTFSNIPSTYTDLILICDGYMATVDGAVINMQFNSDTGSNYSNTYLGGNGASASSGRSSNVTAAYLTSNLIGWDTTSTQRGLVIAHIMNYASTDTYKSVLSRPNLPAADYPGSAIVVNLWRSTAAVTTVAVTSGGTFATGSIFTLYGIKAA